MISIIIADDHALFIDGLKLLLKEEQDIIILDVANDGKELLDILGKQLPEIVLLDINMPGINGLEAARLIKQSYSAVKIIMLSTYSENHLIEKAKQYGANGYLLKNCNKEELLQTIRLVAAGKACLPYNLPKTVNEFSSGDPFLKQFNLSKRETEIIQFIKRDLPTSRLLMHYFLVFTQSRPIERILCKNFS